MDDVHSRIGFPKADGANMRKIGEPEVQDSQVASSESHKHDEDGFGGVGHDRPKPLDGVTASGTTQGTATASDKSSPVSRGRRLLFGVIGFFVFIALLTSAVLYWLDARHIETTDDAAIDGYVAGVSPQVAGRVIRLAVTDSQLVVASQLLVEIDPKDLGLPLDQAKTQYARG